MSPIDALPVTPARWPGPLLAILWVGLVAGCFFLQTEVDGPLPTAMLFLSVALPVAAYRAHLATVRRIGFLRTLSDGSRLRVLISGSWLRILLGLATGLAVALVLAVAMIGFRREDWVVVALAPIVCLLLWRFAVGWVGPETRPTYRASLAIRVTVLAASGILLLVQALVFAARGGAPAYGQLSEAIDAGRAGAAMVGSSPIAAALVLVAGWLNGFQAYFVGLLSSPDGWRWTAGILVSAFLAWVPLFLICQIVAGCLLPLAEFRRVVAAPVEADPPPPVNLGTVFVAAAAAMLGLILYFSAVAALNGFLERQPLILEQLERFEVVVERIDDMIVRPGTIEEIETARIEVLQQLDAEQRRYVEDALNAGFDRMIDNVDAYLDWYYSLPAEYGRLTGALTGDLEDYMGTKFEETLLAGHPFGPLDTLVARLDASDEAGGAELRQKAAEIIARNRVEPVGEAKVRVEETASLEGLVATPPSVTRTTVKQRMGGALAAGTVAGTVGAVLAGKAAAKVLAKGVIKTGAKAASKVLAGKALGSAGGASTGAVLGGIVGSIVPGVGTLIGATAGGLAAGLAVSLGVEYALIELEEAFGRDEHRAELVAAIEEERAATLALLDPGTPAEAPPAVASDPIENQPAVD